MIDTVKSAIFIKVKIQKCMPNNKNILKDMPKLDAKSFHMGTWWLLLSGVWDKVTGEFVT